MTEAGKDEQAELERLRAEVENLRAEVKGGAAPRERRAWGRGTLAVVLLVLAGLLTPITVTALWADRVIDDTDRYVQTVSPLAKDPAIQAAITDRIVTEVQQYVDVEDLATQALTAIGDRAPVDGPLVQQLPSLAGPIADGIENFVRGEVAKIVASDAFQQAWDRANGVAHEQLVGALTGEGSNQVSIEEGTVSVSLAAFIETVKTQLVDNGFGLASNIPAVDLEVVLFQSDDLGTAQRGLRLLDTLAWVLPIVLVALLAAGIWASPSRRRGFVGAGVSVGLFCLATLLGLAIGREFYLDAIPAATLPPDAASAAFDTVIRFLRASLLTFVFLSAVTVAAAVLAGPSRGAVVLRGWWVGGLSRLNAFVRSLGAPTEAPADWVQRNQGWLRILLVAAGVAVVLIWPYPTTRVVAWFVVLVLLGLAIIDFLRAPAADPATSEDSEPDGSDTDPKQPVSA
jgi:hypothetical protein